MDSTLKKLNHGTLINWVRLYAPKIDSRGVCNGVTSMWLQAVITGKEEEDSFYKRLDFISNYLSKPDNSLEKLKEEVDEIYVSQSNPNNDPDFKRKPLTDEELDKIELRAFAESVAIQQKGNVLDVFENYVPEVDKQVQFPYTASAKLEQGTNIRLKSDFPENSKPKSGEMYIEKIGDKLKYTLSNSEGEITEDFLDVSVDSLTKESLEKLKKTILDETSKRGHTSKIRSDIIGVVGLNQDGVEEYFDYLEAALKEDDKLSPNKRGGFFLYSDTHAAGVYFDVSSNKWHFFDVNELSGGKTYYSSLRSDQLASFIFSSFSDNDPNDFEYLNSTIFTATYISSYHDKHLASKLHSITNTFLPNSLGRKNLRGYNTFLSAAYSGDESSLKILLREKSKMDLKLEKIWESILSESEKMNLSEAKRLFSMIPNIVKEDNSITWEAFLYDFKKGKTADLKRTLITSKYIDLVNFRSDNNTTALSLAITNEREGVVKILLSSEPKPSIDTVNIALRAAAITGKIEMLKILLSSDPKANLNFKDSTGWTPLMLAAYNGHHEVTKYMLSLEPKPNVNIKNNAGWTPLMLAAYNGHTEIVKLLLSITLNVDINADVGGWSALKYAVNNRHTDTVKVLLSADPKPNLNLNQNKSREIATEKGYSEIVKYLVDAEFSLAVLNNNIVAIKDLLSGSPKPNLDTVEIEERINPLMWACKKGNIELITMLFSANPKPNLNIQDKEGHTALMLAIKNKNLSIIEALLQCNPQPKMDVINNEGKTVYDLAINDDSIYDLLIKRRPVIVYTQKSEPIKSPTTPTIRDISKNKPK